MKNKVATTVKVENTLYDEFKVLGVRHKLTLQGLVEKTVYRYVTEESFRTEINNFILPVVISAAVTSSISN
jgi:predicted DNA-binding ribbon-helix-helix protein